jgi:hypothetical protein
MMPRSTSKVEESHEKPLENLQHLTPFMHHSLSGDSIGMIKGDKKSVVASWFKLQTVIKVLL